MAFRKLKTTANKASSNDGFRALGTAQGQSFEENKPKESLIQKAERLGIQPATPPQVQPQKENILKTFARGIIKPVATLAVRPIQAVKALSGATEEEQAINLPFLGKIETSTSAKDVVKDIGRGIETVSLGLGGGAAKTAIKGAAKGTFGTVIKAGAKEGAKIGAVGGFGVGLAEEGKVSGALKGAAIGGVAGGAFGAAIPAVAKGIGETVSLGRKGFGKVTTEVDKRLAVRSAQKLEQEALLRGGVADARVAGKTLKGGQIIKDKVANEAMRQGVPDIDVALIKSSSKTDVSKMAKMLEIKKKGLTNKRFSATSRASDVVGDTFLGQAKFIQAKNEAVGKKLGLVAQKLAGKKVDTTSAIEGFVESLQGHGVSFGKKGTIVFKDSIFKHNKETQKAIRDVWVDAVKVLKSKDAFQVHQLKSLIDEIVDYGKKVKGLSGKAQYSIKGFRKNIDDILDTNFKTYNKVNTEFAETIRVMNKIGEISGKRFRLNQEFADAKLGTLMRSIFSNNQRRTQILPLLDEMQLTARKFGMKIDDDIINQASFVDTIEKLFGTDAPTSFTGGIERGVKAAQEAGQIAGTLQKQGPVPAAFRAAGIGIQKIRGINKESQMKALETLLGVKPKTVFGRAIKK